MELTSRNRSDQIYSLHGRVLRQMAIGRYAVIAIGARRFITQQNELTIGQLIRQLPNRMPRRT